MLDFRGPGPAWNPVKHDKNNLAIMEREARERRELQARPEKAGASRGSRQQAHTIAYALARPLRGLRRGFEVV